MRQSERPKARVGTVAQPRSRSTQAARAGSMPSVKSQVASVHIKDSCPLLPFCRMLALRFHASTGQGLPDQGWQREHPSHMPQLFPFSATLPSPLGWASLPLAQYPETLPYLTSFCHADLHPHPITHLHLHPPPGGSRRSHLDSRVPAAPHTCVASGV